MTTERIDDAGRYLRLTAGEGAALTAWDPDMDDIRAFAAYGTVATAARHAGRFREIAAAEAEALGARRAEAEAETEGEWEGE